MADKKKNWANPTHPHDSPITVTHTGWDQTAYTNYTKPKSEQPPSKPVAGRVVQYDSPAEFQKSKTESAQIDKSLDREIQKDLKQRNLKQ